MLLTLGGGGPLFHQVFRAAREAILSGRVRAGERLPVTRALARELGVSRNVVLIAYEQLIAEGYAEGRVGSGTYVAATVPEAMTRAAARSKAGGAEGPGETRLSRYGSRILADPESDAPLTTAGRRTRYDFAYYLSRGEDFPAPLWRQLLSRRLRRLELDYAAVQGDSGLRREIARYLRRTRGIECTAEQVLLVNGSQQAMDLVGRVLLDAGDRVVMENPHYTGAREVFRAVGARIVPVAVDEQGIDVEQLPRSARLAYVTPSHQFPTGAILPLDRRLALLSWAERNQAYILEDDYDGEYRYEGRPVEAVQAMDRTGRVVYTGSFSRVLFPSLRMGYLVAPRALAGALAKAKWIADRHTSFLQQAALADLMREGHLDRLVRRARVRNAARREALLRALERDFGDAVEVRGAAAGVHVLACFPKLTAGDTASLVEAAAKAGVRVYSTAHYYLGAAPRCELLLGYGAMSEREIAAGVRMLAVALGQRR
uniref:Transcriptional regulator, GntR family n=1 Tax=Solibacter usitatus (strain Ellin6076) TaxID=234267 RepID=Q024I6_SOLUE